jgi:hypothetical protein
MPDDDRYWEGPEPSLQERQKSWQFIVEYLKKFPQSSLKNEYPYLFQVAQASKRYDEINFLRWDGKMDEITYQIELEKILPLISVDPSELNK